MSATVVEAFLDSLVAVPGSPTLCNFYRDEVEGADQRRDRLRTYLLEQWSAPLLFVAEAPGYRGARLSGVPMTSLRQLEGGKAPAEATATRIRAGLARHGLLDQVLLWNIVPFHPHKPGDPRSNRPPTRQECQQGLAWVTRLAEGRRIVTVGDKARQHLPGAAGHVRHPSNDTRQEFPAQLEALVASLR